DEGAVLKKRLGFEKTATRIQQLRFFGISDFQAPSLAIAKIALNLIAQMMQVDNDVTNSIALQEQQTIINHWPASHRHQSLGCPLGEGMESCPLTGRQHHRLHRISS